MKKWMLVFVVFAAGCASYYITPADAKGILEAGGYTNIHVDQITHRAVNCATETQDAIPFTATRNGVLVTGMVCDSNQSHRAYIQVTDVAIDRVAR